MKLNKTPYETFQEIQKLQFELDNAKKEQARIRFKVRSLSQIIPEMIRNAKLK